jgi:glycosyltransferase involved in cell wall biosynthesis
MVMRSSRQSRLDILLSIPLAGKLLRECARRGIGHVHVHSCGRAALIAAVANRIGGLDYSLTLHGPLQDYGPLQDFKWRHARFATIITNKLKAEVETELAGNLPGQLYIQPMGVDTERLSRETPYQPFEQSQKLRIFACGRLHIVKGHQVLIDAVGILRDRGFDVQARIAGQDEQQGAGFRKVLADQIERLGLAQNVELLGAVDELEVKRNILSAHIFALASKHEPLGVAYMEAMSCEVPVVGTDAGGVRELIDDGVDGLLVLPDDPQALADAIESLALDPERAVMLGRNGRQKIVSKFSSARGAQTLKQAVFG